MIHIVKNMIKQPLIPKSQVGSTQEGKKTVATSVCYQNSVQSFVHLLPDLSLYQGEWCIFGKR